MPNRRRRSMMPSADARSGTPLERHPVSLPDDALAGALPRLQPAFAQERRGARRVRQVAEGTQAQAIVRGQDLRAGRRFCRRRFPRQHQPRRLRLLRGAASTTGRSTQCVHANQAMLASTSSAKRTRIRLQSMRWAASSQRPDRHFAGQDPASGATRIEQAARHPYRCRAPGPRAGPGPAARAPAGRSSVIGVLPFVHECRQSARRRTPRAPARSR